jgi:RNase P/RNase MRP subunit p29
LITEEELNQYRVDGTRVRVIRDADESNDVRGVVVAWDDSTVLIRKFNKKVVRIDRSYLFQPASEPRISPV